MCSSKRRGSLLLRGFPETLYGCSCDYPVTPKRQKPLTYKKRLKKIIFGIARRALSHQKVLVRKRSFFNHVTEAKRHRVIANKINCQDATNTEAVKGHFDFYKIPYFLE